MKLVELAVPDELEPTIAAQEYGLRAELEILITVHGYDLLTPPDGAFGPKRKHWTSHHGQTMRTLAEAFEWRRAALAGEFPWMKDTIYRIEVEARPRLPFMWVHPEGKCEPGDPSRTEHVPGSDSLQKCVTCGEVFGK